jgi:hypothetical protein
MIATFDWNDGGQYAWDMRSIESTWNEDETYHLWVDDGWGEPEPHTVSFTINGLIRGDRVHIELSDS